MPPETSPVARTAGTVDNVQAAPVSIKAWVALGVAMFVVTALPGGAHFDGSWLGALVVLVFWSWLLVNRSRLAWWVAVIVPLISVLGLVGMESGVGGGPPLDGVVIVVLMAASVVVLLTPSARRWTRRRGR